MWKNTHRRERRRLRGARWDMNRKHAFCSFLFLRKGLEFYSFQRRANRCGAPILNSRHEKPATISNTNEIPAAANAALSGSGAFAEDIEETRESREAPVVSRDPVASVAVSIRVCVFFFNCRVGFSAGVPSAIQATARSTSLSRSKISVTGPSRTRPFFSAPIVFPHGWSSAPNNTTARFVPDKSPSSCALGPGRKVSVLYGKTVLGFGKDPIRTVTQRGRRERPHHVAFLRRLRPGLVQPL